MRFALAVSGALLALFSTSASAEPCRGGTVGINYGKQVFESNDKLVVNLPGNLGTYEKKSDHSSDLQVGDINYEQNIACTSFGGSGFPKGSIAGLVGVETAQGQIKSPTNKDKDLDVKSTAIFAGPKLCLVFSEGTNLCGGLLTKASHLKIGDGYETDAGSFSPLLAIEQILGDRFMIRVQATATDSKTKIQESSQDFKTANYTLGIAYVFGNPTGNSQTH